TCQLIFKSASYLFCYINRLEHLFVLVWLLQLMLLFFQTTQGLTPHRPLSS
ncbi:hypothetical protein S83_012005, partial [Arachis hypogaea]